MSVLKRGNSKNWYIQFQFKGKTYIRSSRTTDKRLAYKIYVDNCERLEKDVHRQLRQYRVRDNREFFEVDLTTVVLAIEEIHAPLISEDEEEESSFNPLSYVQHLVTEREIEEDEQKLRQNAAVIEVRTYLHALFEILAPLNGQYNSIGNAIYFCMQEDDDRIMITKRERLDEEPDGVTLVTYVGDYRVIVSYEKSEGPLSISDDSYGGDLDGWDGEPEKMYETLSELNKSPQQLAKYIIGMFSWASEGEAQKRRNPSISLMEMLQMVWVDAADEKNQLLYIEINKEREMNPEKYTWLSAREEEREERFKEYFRTGDWLKYIPPVTEALCDAAVIPRIVGDSWASIIPEYDLDELDERTRNYYLSIDCIIPDEPDSIEATVEATVISMGDRYTRIRTKCGEHELWGCDFSEYLGKKVRLKKVRVENTWPDKYGLEWIAELV